MIGYIYKTTNKLNNKIYVGQHKVNDNKFDTNYFGSGKLIMEAIEKYGKENFVCEILEWCETEEEMNEKEIFYIEFLKSKVIDGNYNISDGGYVPRLSGELNGMYDKHIPKTQDQKDHQSSVMKGHRPFFVGHHSEEVRKRMSEGSSRHNKTEKDYDAVKRANTGKRFMNDGVNQMWVNQQDIERYLKEGWSFGACKKRNRDYTKSCGTVCINNGNQNKFVCKDDLDEYVSNGWVIGKCPRTHDTKISMNSQ